MRRRAARIMPAMPDRVFRVASLVPFALCAVLSPSPAAACPVAKGAPLVLISQELDPDVFLWDSADRLSRYAAGDYTVETVLKHTTLVRAYSRAFAVGCKNQAIRQSYTGDAASTVYVVGVRISTGRARGHYGWVLSSDVRGPDGRVLTFQGHPR